MGDQKENFADLLGHYLEDMGFTQQELANKIGMHRNTIVNWLNRTSRPTSRGQVLKVADELALSKEERKALIQSAGFSLERWPTEIWTVPEPRDMFFTGRETVFQSLHELLVPGSTTALTQAISGLGGIGKTHTAVEYAYRFHQDYEAVLWLQADAWDVLVSACIQLADVLELPEQKEADQVVGEVQRWLRKHHHWLLILDNVENPQEILPKFVPSGHQGCVLVTTRVQSVEPLAQTQMLLTMSEQEGVLFLLRRTKRIAAKAGLEKASPEQYEEARQIWQLMDGLPLALDQAGAYILETGCSFFAYQEQYARRRAELLPRRGKRFIGHEASVATTFSLAFEKVKVLNTVAADVLRVCSLLSSEPIPEELFQEGAESLELPLVENGSLDEALGVLQDYSLVLRNREGKLLAIHRLVQAVLQDEIEEAERQRWTKRVVLAVNLVFPHPQVEHATWPRCEQLLSHALRAAHYIQTDHIISEEAGHLLNKTATYLHERARYAEAEPLYLSGLQIFEQHLGPEHPFTVKCLGNLAELYRQRGKYAEAELLFQRVLRTWEQYQDPDYLHMAGSFNNLATLYKEQGKYAEADLFYQRAQQIFEQHLGPEHLSTVKCLTNLALLYNEQDKYAKAEPLFHRAFAIYEQHLGLEHPEAGSLHNGLAILYHKQGRYAEAEPLYQRALRIREQQWGPEHPEVAYPLHNLATLYNEQGKYAEAEPLFLRTIRIREQHLGSEHPDVAYPLNNLASLYYQQGKYAEAEPLFLRTIRIREQHLGPEHHLVGDLLNNLAILYKEQGKYAEAEPLYQRALHIREQQWGPDHPDVSNSLNGLANLYCEQGNYAEAEPLYQRALHIQEQQWSPDHPRVAYPLHNLAELYKDQGKHAEAEPLYQRALHIWKQSLGTEHPLVAYPLNGLANLYREQSKYAEAELLYQQALHIREQQLGPEHPATAETTHDFAQFWETQGNNEKARSWYVRALAVREQALGAHHPATKETRTRLIALLHTLGQHEDAAQL